MTHRSLGPLTCQASVQVPVADYMNTHVHLHRKTGKWRIHALLFWTFTLIFRCLLWKTSSSKHSSVPITAPFNKVGANHRYLWWKAKENYAYEEEKREDEAHEILENGNAITPIWSAKPPSLGTSLVSLAIWIMDPPSHLNSKHYAISCAVFHIFPLPALHSSGLFQPDTGLSWRNYQTVMCLWYCKWRISWCVH